MSADSLSPKPVEDASRDAECGMDYEDASTRPARDLPGPDELPITLTFNDTAYATVLATPDDLESLALGFAFSEGMILRREEVAAITLAPSRHGFRVRLEVDPRVARRAEEGARVTLSTSGCGACGAQSEAQVMFGMQRLDPRPPPPAAHVQTAQAALVQRARPGLHLALGLDEAGEVYAMGQDIGRHNALDKLIGQSLASGRWPALVMMSSRCSLELVQKTVHAGIPALATLSHPSHLAIDMARLCALTLINCHRGKRLELLSRS
ncbi:formate dehydrogenase accessory sulfurtransferase FdhD [Halomonas shantousis]